MASKRELERRIKALETQINSKIEVTEYGSLAHGYFGPSFYTSNKYDLTLAGKVAAIVDHLKLNITVEEPQRTPAKIVATIAKPAKKTTRRK